MSTEFLLSKLQVQESTLTMCHFLQIPCHLSNTKLDPKKNLLCFSHDNSSLNFPLLSNPPPLPHPTSPQNKQKKEKKGKKEKEKVTPRPPISFV